MQYSYLKLLDMVSNNSNINSISKFSTQRSRMSNRQKSIFNQELSQYSYDRSNFYSNNNLILDIGFGNGQQLLYCCESMPDYNFIGIELYKKGIANCLAEIKQKNLQNIKIVHGEAKTALQQLFYDHSLTRIQILFPDPWPKRRHYKRRLIQPEFVNIVRQKLCVAGILHIATDCDNYANYIISILSAMPMFKRIHHTQDCLTRAATKFENIGLKAGRHIWDLVFVLQF